LNGNRDDLIHLQLFTLAGHMISHDTHDAT
jgi:hypothetical protein